MLICTVKFLISDEHQQLNLNYASDTRNGTVAMKLSVSEAVIYTAN